MKLLPNSDGGDSGDDDGTGVDGRGNRVGDNHGVTVVVIVVILVLVVMIAMLTAMTSLPWSAPVNPDSSLTAFGSIPSLA